MRPVPGGFVPARDTTGGAEDLFDFADHLIEQYGRMYVVDLEGLSRNRPQLDYLQELARSGEMWVEAGVRRADEVIDVLVTGAARAVISTGYLLGFRELRRAWRFSPDVLFAIEVANGSIRPRGNDWDGQDPSQVATTARALGLPGIVLTARSGPADWGLVRSLAAGGPVWVGGGFTLSQLDELQRSGAAGGIFEPSGVVGSIPEIHHER
jgi:phosphoribosylformimino-5-aminoimidazole carboxamide ribonucleotide (ProFAR) isomerase